MTKNNLMQIERILEGVCYLLCSILVVAFGHDLKASLNVLLYYFFGLFCDSGGSACLHSETVTLYMSSFCTSRP